jgi:hypothetical protein
MTNGLYNKANLVEAGRSSGKLINMGVKKEREFWIYLKKNTSDSVYMRIKFFILITLSCILEVIFRTIFTLLFGPLWPVSFPFGFIKLTVYTCLGYFIGFESSLMYNNLIEKTVMGDDLYNKILKNVRRQYKSPLPLKKRSASETNLTKCDTKEE